MRMIKTETPKETKYKPTIRDMLTIPYVGYSTINSSGSKVAYLMGELNLKENNWGAQCYIYDLEKKTNKKIVNDSNSSNIRWLDNDSLAMIKYNPSDGNRQIFIYDNLLGDGLQVTNHHSSIISFEIFQDGFIFLSSESPEQNKIGNFKHVEEEKGSSRLYYINKEIAKKNREEETRFFDEENEEFPESCFEITEIFQDSFLIESYVISPKNNTIFLTCRSKADLYFENTKFHYRIKLDAQKTLDEINHYKKNKQEIKDISSMVEVTKIALPIDASILAVSPDETKILIKHKGRDLKDYTQSDLWILDLIENVDKLHNEATTKEALFCLTKNLDQEPGDVRWTRKGIFLAYWNESKSEFARFDETGKFDIIELQGLSIKNFFHFNDKGDLSFAAFSSKLLEEIYLARKIEGELVIERITNINDFYSNWDFGKVESIKWKSKDGVEIEGILRKPSDFDPTKKYPLLFFIHGGPAAVSPLALLTNQEITFHPTIQMCNKGVIIFSPNYRGSTGRGQWFRELNFDNLGVGDLWDIESGIDYLVEQGFIDESRIGSMGGSQGGYISAFAGMHSDRFRAVSVGSCAASWYTYYITSDLRDSILLAGEPFSKERDVSIKKTAPISAIKKANTPMLLQHGANDQRTGVANANELFRALKHKGVHTEFFMYNDAGHGYNSPRNFYALMLQNFRWFSHYLLDEELDFFKNDY
jgi:dipeptidyl aminopeptidase/acylaminoacyl peptidase